MSMMEGICGKVAPGLCRLSMGGGIAVKTRAGHRTYDPEAKQLVNCDSFVLDVGEDFFFVVPANRVRPGDIILSDGKPRCVTAVGEVTITALNFDSATVETLRYGLFDAEAGLSRVEKDRREARAVLPRAAACMVTHLNETGGRLAGQTDLEAFTANFDRVYLSECPWDASSASSPAAII